MEYELTPIKPIIFAREGGKGRKMPKQTNTVDAPVAKTYNKTRAEHLKDIIITVLITGIIAFIGGAMFQSKQQDAINTAVQAVAPTANAEASK